MTTGCPSSTVTAILDRRESAAVKIWTMLFCPDCGKMLGHAAAAAQRGRASVVCESCHDNELAAWWHAAGGARVELAWPDELHAFDKAHQGRMQQAVAELAAGCAHTAEAVSHEHSGLLDPARMVSIGKISRGTVRGSGENSFATIGVCTR